MTTFNDDLLDDGGQPGGAFVPETEYPPEAERMPWSNAQLDRSLASALAARPPGPLRVFAYGSLMWQPSIAFDAEEVATLDGWHRSYCLRAENGRGSLQCPGRELSLQPGGRVQAVALRLQEDTAPAELRKLWSREMVNGGYRPAWTPIRLAAGGKTVMALSFVAKPGHPLHETDASVETVARLAAVAAGDAGTNADYVRDAARALAERELKDAYVEAVARAVDAGG